jgi:hypothetical protein
LDSCKLQVVGGELHHHLLLSRVEFTHIRSVSPSEDLVLGRRFEGLGVLCDSISI